MSLFNNYIPDNGDLNLSQAGEIEKNQENLQDYYLSKTYLYKNYVLILPNGHIIDTDLVSEMLEELLTCKQTELLTSLLQSLSKTLTYPLVNVLSAYQADYLYHKFNDINNLKSNDKLFTYLEATDMAFIQDKVNFDDIRDVFNKYKVNAFDLYSNLLNDREDFAEYLYEKS